MAEPTTLTYEAQGRVARITLDRPERGYGITPRMPAESDAQGFFPPVALRPTLRIDWA